MSLIYKQSGPSLGAQTEPGAGLLARLGSKAPGEVGDWLQDRVDQHRTRVRGMELATEHLEIENLLQRMNVAARVGAAKFRVRKAAGEHPAVAKAVEKLIANAPEDPEGRRRYMAEGLASIEGLALQAERLGFADQIAERLSLGAYNNPDTSEELREGEEAQPFQVAAREAIEALRSEAPLSWEQLEKLKAHDRQARRGVAQAQGAILQRQADIAWGMKLMENVEESTPAYRAMTAALAEFQAGGDYEDFRADIIKAKYGVEVKGSGEAEARRVWRDAWDNAKKRMSEGIFDEDGNPVPPDPMDVWEAAEQDYRAYSLMPGAVSLDEVRAVLGAAQPRPIAKGRLKEVSTKLRKSWAKMHERERVELVAELADPEGYGNLTLEQKYALADQFWKRLPQGLRDELDQMRTSSNERGRESALEEEVEEARAERESRIPAAARMRGVSGARAPKMPPRKEKAKPMRRWSELDQAQRDGLRSVLASLPADVNLEEALRESRVLLEGIPEEVLALWRGNKKP